MHRFSFTLCAAALAAAAFAPLASPAASAPALRLVSQTPFVVAGRGFKPQERVRIVVTSPDYTGTRRLAAGTRGAFRVSFGSAQLDRCQAWSVRATGSRGSTALLRHSAVPDCAPLGAKK